MLLQGYLDHLRDLVFDADASASDLFIIACAWGVFWAVFIPTLDFLLTPLVYGKPWLVAMFERELERNGGVEAANKASGTKKTKEEMIDEAMKNYLKWNILVCFQHGVSGLLCIPSLLGRGDPSWASSLAVNGILCEMGWELTHFIGKFFMFHIFFLHLHAMANDFIHFTQSYPTSA